MLTEVIKLCGEPRSRSIAGATRGGGGISVEGVSTCPPWWRASWLARRNDKLGASFISGGGMGEVVEPNEALRDHDPEFALVLVKGT